MPVTLGSTSATAGTDFSTTVSGLTAGASHRLVNTGQGRFQMTQSGDPTATTETLTGRGLQPGTTRLVVQDGNTQTSFDITVAPAAAVVDLSATVTPPNQLTVGDTVNIPAPTLAGGTGPYTYRLLDSRGSVVVGLPVGVTFNNGAFGGSIAGREGLYGVVVEATDATGKKARTKPFSLSVQPSASFYVPPVAGGGAGGGTVIPPLVTRAFTIANSGVALTDYQVKVPVTWEAGMRTDFKDVRFSDSTTSLSFWIEPDFNPGVSAVAWVKVPTLTAGGSKVITLQFGGGVTTSASDIGAAMLFGDEFEGAAIDSGKWGVTVTGTSAWAFTDTWWSKPLLTGLAGNQGLAVDANFVYFGKDNGQGAAGTIYKYNRSGGSLVTSFTAPAHVNSLDFRENGNLLAGSAGDTTVHTLWEITPAGVKVREWDFTGKMFYPDNGPNATYHSPGKILNQSANADGSAFAIELVQLNDDGSIVRLQTWQQTLSVPVARMQTIKWDAAAQLLRVIIDDGTATTAYGQVVSYSLNNDGTTTVVDQWEHLPSGEREGLAFDGTNWFYSTNAGTVNILYFEGGMAKFTAAGATGRVAQAVSSATFGIGTEIIGRMSAFGMFPSMDFGNVANTDVVGIGRFSTSLNTLSLRARTASTTTDTGLTGTGDYNSMHKYAVARRLDGSVEVFLDGVSQGSFTTNVPQGALSVRVGGGTSTQTTGFQASVPFVAVRKVAAVEPTVTAGSSPGVTLGTPVLNGALTSGTAASGVTISGLTDGSTYAFNIAGISVGTSGTTRTVTGTPGASGSLTGTETLAGATNSPRGPLGLGTVANASGIAFRQPATGEPYILGVLGASRQKQAAGTTDLGTAKRLNSGTNGWVNWLRGWLPGIEVEVIADDTLVYNSLLYYGTMFANDGNSISVMRSRLQAMVDSDIHAAVVDFSIGSEFVSGTVSNYTSKLQFAITFLRANGINAIWFEQYERGSVDGGGWGDGGSNSVKVEQVISVMNTWCAAQTPPVPIMRTRDVLIIPGTNTPQPYAYRSPGSDETHPQPIGGQRLAKARRDQLRTLFPDVTINASRAANIAANPTLAGRNAMTAANGVSGFVPDGGYVASAASGQSSTVAVDVVTINGVRMIEATVTRSTMPNDSTARSESFKVVVPHATMANAKYWKARARQSFGGGSGLRAQMTTLRDNQSSESFARAMTSINSSGTFLTDASALFQDTAAYGVDEVFRARSYAVPFANAAAATMELSANWDRGDGSPLVLRWAEPEVWEVADPHLVMYNEAVAGPAQITSSASRTTPEGQPVSIQLTANLAGTWSISGGDASSFSAPDPFGVMSMSERYFDSPADANADNVYTTTVTFTPKNPAIAAVTQTLNVSVTKVVGLFVDNFNRADGNLLPDATRYTTSGTGTQVPSINANRLGTSTGSGRLALIPVGQNAGAGKRISASNRLSAVAGGIYLCPILQDADNWIGIKSNSSTITVDSRVAGTAGTTVTLTRYTAYNAGETLMAQVDASGQNVEVYQNGVSLGTAPVVSALQSVKQGGIIFANTSSAATVFDDLTIQDRSDYTSKTAFRPITYADGTTSKTAQPTSGSLTITGYTLGSQISRGTVSNIGTGTITADGDVIRWDGLATGTSFTIPVIETDTGELNAVNSPRTSNLTLATA